MCIDYRIKYKLYIFANGNFRFVTMHAFDRPDRQTDRQTVRILIGKKKQFFKMSTISVSVGSAMTAVFENSRSHSF